MNTILKNFKRGLKDFFFGFLYLPYIKNLLEHYNNEDLALMTITLGDMLGMPLMPPIYKLRLLPLWYPRIEYWKKRMLVEKSALEKLKE